MMNKLTFFFSFIILVALSACSKDDKSGVDVVGKGTVLRYTLYSEITVEATNVLGLRNLDTTVFVNDIEAKLKALDSRLDVSKINSIQIIGARLFFRNPNTGGHNFDFLTNVEGFVQVENGSPLKVLYLNPVPLTTKNLDLQYDHANNYQAYFDKSTFKYIIKGNIRQPLATPATMVANISVKVTF